MGSWPIFRLLFWLYLLFLVYAYGTVHNPADPDLWHRLTLGQYLALHHAFPPGGTFSYLADYKNIADHEWGSAVTFYSVYAMTGEGPFFGSAMIALKLAALATTLALVVAAGLRRRVLSLLAAGFYALVLFALLPSFLSTLRCVVFTHVFFALWIYFFQVERQGRRIPLPAYLVSMLMWANLHGGFAIGLLWLALVAVVEVIRGGEWQKWLVRLVLCGLVTLVNPFGWNLWISTLRALAAPRAGFSEWQAVNWLTGDYPGYKLLLATVLCSVGLVLWRRKAAYLDRGILALIGVFALISLTAGRQTSLFSIVAGALLPGQLPPAPSLDSMVRPLRRLTYLALALFVMIVPLYAGLLLLPGDGLRMVLPPSSCPVAAIAFLQENKVSGDLLTPFNYGSYAMWKLRGKMRVSMDGRYDLAYRPATYKRVADFYLGLPNGQLLLKSPRPAAVLVPRDDAVYPKLLANPAWRQADHAGADAVFLPSGL